MEIENAHPTESTFQSDADIFKISEKIEEILTDERFNIIKEKLESIPAGESVISAVQETIFLEGNKLRTELGLPTIELSGLECAGFNMDEYDSYGNPIVLSYLTGEALNIGHTKSSPSGSFTADRTGLRTALISFCLK